jgi:hypothetical protein
MMWWIFGGIYAVAAVLIFALTFDEDGVGEPVLIALLWPLLFLLTVIELIVGVVSELWRKLFG